MTDALCYALVDCNNFFVSCERVFDPTLDNKPVVVLSNNDGCIISRSNEAKALGIPMGAPLFKYEDVCRRFNVSVLSSNFQLYNDMSWRVMATVKSLAQEVEIYSVDEAFVRLKVASNADLSIYGHTLRDRIRQWTGIPVSVGIGATKTLAKLANETAKKGQGVCSLMEEGYRDKTLSQLMVEDIWGIGRKLAPSLRMLGIGTAIELRDTEPRKIRNRFGVMVERTLYELRGIPCYEIETKPEPRKSITCSRSFGRAVTNMEDLEEAIANYAASACEKLRRQANKAYGICIWLQTKRFGIEEERYHNSTSYRFVLPTNDTSNIISKAKSCLKALYKPGYKYNKVGITLMDLTAESSAQHNLLEEERGQIKKDRLLKLLDKVNGNMGRGKLFFAAQGTSRDWKMKSNRRSPRYTTIWNELLRVG